jgi:hypothetical protein
MDTESRSALIAAFAGTADLGSAAGTLEKTGVAD